MVAMMIVTVASTTTLLAQQDSNAKKAAVSRLVEGASVPKVKLAKTVCASARMLVQLSNVTVHNAAWEDDALTRVRWCNVQTEMSVRAENAFPTTAMSQVARQGRVVSAGCVRPIHVVAYSARPMNFVAMASAYRLVWA